MAACASLQLQWTEDMVLHGCGACKETSQEYGMQLFEAYIRQRCSHRQQPGHKKYDYERAAVQYLQDNQGAGGMLDRVQVRNITTLMSRIAENVKRAPVPSNPAARVHSAPPARDRRFGGRGAPLPPGQARLPGVAPGQVQPGESGDEGAGAVDRGDRLGAAPRAAEEAEVRLDLNYTGGGQLGATKTDFLNYYGNLTMWNMSPRPTDRRRLPSGEIATPLGFHSVYGVDWARAWVAAPQVHAQVHHPAPAVRAPAVGGPAVGAPAPAVRAPAVGSPAVAGGAAEGDPAAGGPAVRGVSVSPLQESDPAVSEDLGSPRTSAEEAATEQAAADVEVEWEPSPGVNAAHELFCPISMALMRDPVLCVGDGFTYDRESIQRYFQEMTDRPGNVLSPTTNAPMESIDLCPNVAVRSQIHSLLEGRGDQWADYLQGPNHRRVGGKGALPGKGGGNGDRPVDGVHFEGGKGGGDGNPVDGGKGAGRPVDGGKGAGRPVDGVHFEGGKGGGDGNRPVDGGKGAGRPVDGVVFEGGKGGGDGNRPVDGVHFEGGKGGGGNGNRQQGPPEQPLYGTDSEKARLVCDLCGTGSMGNIVNYNKHFLSRPHARRVDTLREAASTRSIAAFLAPPPGRNAAAPSQGASTAVELGPDGQPKRARIDTTARPIFGIAAAAAAAAGPLPIARPVQAPRTVPVDPSAARADLE